MPDNIPGELNPPPRVLLGPGPSAVSARVLNAMTKPIMGYLDPEFINLMDSVADMLRQVFGAQEGFTLPVSGTGSAGMEAGLANLLEPGDLAVVAAHGLLRRPPHRYRRAPGRHRGPGQHRLGQRH